ncbi:MAG: riboflavin synthase [Methylococcaceae bacterium]
MFTGIIQAQGTLTRIEPRGGDHRLTVHSEQLPFATIGLGDSIAVNGVCLTAVALSGHTFTADVSNETLSRTTLGGWTAGTRVNLELALLPTTRLGGHLVSGHVDGVGVVIGQQAEARSVRFTLEAPAALARYLAEKGSVTVDGISLTINAVNGACFELNIVPHTLSMTTLGAITVGQRVNLEVDILARYLERLLLGDRASQPHTSDISMDVLKNSGFIS